MGKNGMREEDLLICQISSFYHTRSANKQLSKYSGACLWKVYFCAFDARCVIYGEDGMGDKGHDVADRK